MTDGTASTTARREVDAGSTRAIGAPSPRVQLVDAIRGAAILGVVLFHLVWDLAYLGLTSQALAQHPLWIAFGRGLAGTFMILVGVSLVLASQGGLNRRAFLRRLVLLALAAGAITLVTRIAFLGAYVYFGILHAIAVASVLALPLLRIPVVVVLLIGVTVVGAGSLIETPAFDARGLAWIGFAAAPAFSNDFVPLFPWFGWTAFGVALARIAFARDWAERLPAADGPATRALAWYGRWSLAIYLVHQPVLLAVLVPVARFLEP